MIMTFQSLYIIKRLKNSFQSFLNIHNIIYQQKIITKITKLINFHFQFFKSL